MDNFLHVEDRMDLGIYLYWHFLVNSFSILVGGNGLNCTEEEEKGL